MTEKRLDGKEDTERDRAPTDIRKEIVDVVKRHVSLTDSTWNGTSDEKQLEFERILMVIRGALAQGCARMPLVLAMLKEKPSKSNEVSVPLSGLPENLRERIAAIADERHLSEQDALVAILSEYIAGEW
jgi:hypothetical protein